MNGYVNIRQDIADLVESAFLGGGNKSEILLGANSHIQQIYNLNKPVYISSSSFRGIATIGQASNAYFLTFNAAVSNIQIIVLTDDRVTVTLK